MRVVWALARWPTILPGLTIEQAAAGHDTLVWVTVCVLAGGILLLPALGLLFALTLKGRLTADRRPAGQQRTRGMPTGGIHPHARASIASLIAGFALLNIADAAWAHAVGIACLLGFVLTSFRAITFTAFGPGFADTSTAGETGVRSNAFDHHATAIEARNDGAPAR